MIPFVRVVGVTLFAECCTLLRNAGLKFGRAGGQIGPRPPLTLGLSALYEKTHLDSCFPFFGKDVGLMRLTFRTYFPYLYDSPFLNEIRGLL